MKYSTVISSALAATTPVVETIPHIQFINTPTPYAQCSNVMATLGDIIGLDMSAIGDLLGGLLRTGDAKITTDSIVTGLAGVAKKASDRVSAYQIANKLPAVMGRGAHVLAQMIPILKEEGLRLEDSTGATRDLDLASLVPLLQSILRLEGAEDMLTGFLGAPTTSAVFQGLAESGSRSSYLELNSSGRNFGSGLCDAIAIGHNKDFNPERSICAITSLVAALLACSDSAPTCTSVPEGIPFASMNKNFWNTDVGAEIGTKSAWVKFPENPEAVDFVDYILWRIVTNIQVFADNVPCNASYDDSNILSPDAETSHNLEVIRYVHSRQDASKYYGEHANGSPLAAHIVNRIEGEEKECQFISAIRGTTTEYEWFADFQFQMVPIPGVPNPSMKAHRAFLELTDGMVGTFYEDIINEFESGNCAPENTDVYFTGHSLGAGSANVLATRLVSKLNDLGVRSANVVGFAPPKALNNKAADYLSKHLTTERNYAFDLDYVTSIPCASEGGYMPRCDARRFLGAWGEGVEPELYANYNGEISFGASSFKDDYAFHYTDRKLLRMDFASIINGLLDGIMQGLGGINSKMTAEAYYLNLPGPVQLGSVHSCSYPCLLTHNESMFTAQHGCTRQFTEEEGCTDIETFDQYGVYAPFSGLKCVGKTTYPCNSILGGALIAVRDSDE